MKKSLIKRCLKDPQFREKLFREPHKVLEEEGYNIPAGWRIRFEEETQDKTFTIRIPKAMDELTIEQLANIVGGYGGFPD